MYCVGEHQTTKTPLQCGKGDSMTFYRKKGGNGGATGGGEGQFPHEGSGDGVANEADQLGVTRSLFAAGFQKDSL